MIKIVVFGTGSSARSFVSNLDLSKSKIVGYLDNNFELAGSSIGEALIYSPNQISHLTFDYVVIASQFVEPISEQLIQFGVEPKKIIPFYYRHYSDQVQNYHKSVLDSLYTQFSRKKARPEIALISNSFSGCNARALYEFIPDKIKEQFEVQLITENSENNVAHADVVVTTHRNFTLKGDHINIELWHGFPLKAMGRMNIQTEDSANVESWLEVQGIASYSALYTTLMSACFPARGRQFYITGVPRNDYLFYSNGRQCLENVLNVSLNNQKILFYMPTFRTYQSRGTIEGARDWSRLFDFEDFNHLRFKKFLERNNIALVVKLHNFEEQSFMDQAIQHPNIHLINDALLEEHALDLYQVLNAAGMLITDYSSIYFDYLLLNRPILFTATDLEEYRSTRGFLLEPYDWWTPGDKANSQAEMENYILNALEGRDSHDQQRKVIRNLVHHYQDGHSAERVWDMIRQFVEARMVS
ncbi:CDP-glycerol glycerophosphotransferase family protein [Cohnella algarum]|uniref:CDP-glycerol glycerophosphotransferase family protein n=1 Tax=Cohnella algarum TaxID=2044859 RepID=UPI0019685481|nr:CDP-glycerol glycerophosphotransferase family protein [Cohnella algarum]MBN2980620.1 CDP-glycerol glycerophosphotransferase family protein [Cohnella algarum]